MLSEMYDGPTRKYENIVMIDGKMMNEADALQYANDYREDGETKEVEKNFKFLKEGSISSDSSEEVQYSKLNEENEVNTGNDNQAFIEEDEESRITENDEKNSVRFNDSVKLKDKTEESDKFDDFDDNASEIRMESYENRKYSNEHQNYHSGSRKTSRDDSIRDSNENPRKTSHDQSRRTSQEDPRRSSYEEPRRTSQDHEIIKRERKSSRTSTPKNYAEHRNQVKDELSKLHHKFSSPVRSNNLPSLPSSPIHSRHPTESSHEPKHRQPRPQKRHSRTASIDGSSTVGSSTSTPTNIKNKQVVTAEINIQAPTPTDIDHLEKFFGEKVDDGKVKRRIKKN